MKPKVNPDLDDTVDTEFKPTPSNAPKLKKGPRDVSLVKVIVLAHCAPVGVVSDLVFDEEGNQLFDEGQPLLGKDGQPVLDASGQPKLGDPTPRTEIKERTLAYKERVLMQKWCADIMASQGREHVEIL